MSAYTRVAQAREQIRKFADQPNGDDGLTVWHLATAYRTVGREKKQAGTGRAKAAVCSWRCCGYKVKLKLPKA